MAIIEKPIDAADPEPAVPLPPRFYWLKLLGGAVVAVAVILFEVRAWNIHLAQARIDAAIAHLRENGEPTSAQDMTTPPVPDAENAAIVFREAAAGVVFPPGGSGDEFSLFFSPPMDQSLAAVRSIVQTNARSLELMRRVRGMPRVRWAAAELDPDGHLAEVQNFRRLARLLRFAADLAIREGDAIAFADYMRDELDIGRVLAAAPIYAFQYEGQWSESFAWAAIYDGGPVLPAMLDKPGARQAINDLLKEVVDESAHDARIRRLIEQERVDYIRALSSSSQSIHLQNNEHTTWEQRYGDFLRYLSKASILRYGAENLESLTQLKRAFAQSSTALQTIQQSRIVWPELDFSVRKLAFTSIYQARIWEAFYLLLIDDPLSNRRMSAYNLAVRLYQFDHSGKMPHSLEELKPYELPLSRLPRYRQGDNQFELVSHNQWTMADRFWNGEID